MKLKALAVLAAALLASCGGGDDSDDNDSASSQPAPAPASPKDAKAPHQLEGKATQASVIDALALEKDGSTYAFSGGPCKVNDFAFTKGDVENLTNSAQTEENVIKNDSGTAAVELKKLDYFCAIQAANRLKFIP